MTLMYRCDNYRCNKLVDVDGDEIPPSWVEGNWGWYCCAECLAAAEPHLVPPK